MAHLPRRPASRTETRRNSAFLRQSVQFIHGRRGKFQFCSNEYAAGARPTLGDTERSAYGSYGVAHFVARFPASARRRQDEPLYEHSRGTDNLPASFRHKHDEMEPQNRACALQRGESGLSQRHGRCGPPDCGLLLQSADGARERRNRPTEPR